MTSHPRNNPIAKWIDVARQPRGWVYVILSIAILASVLQLPDRIKTFIEPRLPLLNLLSDVDAQYRLNLDPVPYDVLRAVDALLPRDATLLLVTSGRDVRHLEYTTFHRALYFLTPRSVWWLSPAPSDGTWEARWWISSPLTLESIRAVADQKQADYILTFDLALPLSIGREVRTWPNAALLQLNEAKPVLADQTIKPIAANAAWPISIGLALSVSLLLGRLFMRRLPRFGYQPGRVEALTLTWIIGSGLTSIGMLWLNALGLKLNMQIGVLTLIALIALPSVLQSWRSYWRERLSSKVKSLDLKTTIVSVLLLSLFLIQVAFAVSLILSTPLGGWDSWSSWGLRARTIFVDGSISPAVYADPARASTLPYYPLYTPLLEAWLYGWLNAPDDRLAGFISILFYFALAGACYAAVRRRGGDRNYALAVMVAVTSVPWMSLLAGLTFVDISMAALITLAVVYLIEWLDSGSISVLIIAALCAGLMPWAKREGWVLLMSLCLAAIVWRGRSRRAWIGVGSNIGASLLIAGPWWLFVSIAGYVRSEFLPVTLATLQANFDRLTTIRQLTLEALGGSDWSYLWQMGLIFGVLDLLVQVRTIRSIIRRTDNILPLTAVIFLGAMAASYLFSGYTPFEAHILSSWYRLAVQVLPLIVVWLAYRGLDHKQSAQGA